jgi:phospholipid transport system substrate-binding protein
MTRAFCSIGGALAAVWLLAAPAAGAMAADIEAEAVVRGTTDRVLETLRREGDSLKTDPQRLYDLVEDVVVPHFDFEKMSQWVLGRHWRGASAEQRAAFVQQFEKLLVRTYSLALAEYRDQTVQYQSARARSDSEATVRAAIDTGGGPEIPIVYEMHKTEGGWKVYDVAVDGVSLVITYRSSFGQEIRRNGLDSLIRRMGEKNQANG